LGGDKARCLTVRFLILPVEGGPRTGARTVGGGFPVKLLRLLDGFTVPPCSRFQLPPRQTEHVAFPHSACLFASYQGLWDLLCWERFRLTSWSLHPVGFAQVQVLIQPMPPSAEPLLCMAHRVPVYPIVFPHGCGSFRTVAEGQASAPCCGAIAGHLWERWGIVTLADHDGALMMPACAVRRPCQCPSLCPCPRAQRREDHGSPHLTRLAGGWRV